MDASRLRLCRSLLFLPASNPRAIEKARGLDADMIVLDLEDAVKPEDKAEARRLAEAAVRDGFGGRPVAVRINAVGSPFFGDDVVAVRRMQPDHVVLAKAETPKQVADAAWLTAKRILAMVETARGVIDAAAIAQATGGLVAGTNDLAADLHIPANEGRRGLSYALQRIVLAARAAGVPAFDGVYNKLDDEEGLAEQCREGRAFGFDGKSLIHPGQIATANRIFSPAPGEVEEALRLIAAATGGAERFEGRMIEAMHVEQARALVAKARL
ncbi:MAG: HpcH/HpaI aldolase/citrate lyase family protein [Allosphingosinicella sp.]|uniref:HpcH/HpaI aldolase/citrate lyase family protein n=1 Tax=Allosphingosinicella sp. TaxID=2823234 RepID=UPI00393AB544